MATAARLGSRIDAGLLAGCVVTVPRRARRSRARIASPSPARCAEPSSRRSSGCSAARNAGAPRGGRANSAQLAARLRRACAPCKAQALQVENDQLRKLIGLGSRLEWGFVPAEALHSTAPSEDVVTTLTLAAGSTAGIQAVQPGRRAGGTRRHDLQGRPDDEHRSLIHEPGFSRERDVGRRRRVRHRLSARRARVGGDRVHARAARRSDARQAQAGHA